jgi:hypothetical protein
VEGGFDVDDSKKYDIQETYAIVTLPDFTSVPYPNPNLPEKVKEIFHVTIIFFFVDSYFL